MFLNKKLIVTTLALSVCCSYSIAGAFGESGTLHINGSINDNTCTLATTSKIITVNLATVNTSQFAKVGSYAGEKSFDINLDNCPKAAKLAKVSFNGDAVDGTVDILKATGEGSGVGFAIFATTTEGKTATTPLNLGIPSWGYTLKEANNSLRFVVKYRANVDGNKMVPGSVKGSAKFTVTYY